MGLFSPTACMQILAKSKGFNLIVHCANNAENKSFTHLDVTFAALINMSGEVYQNVHELDNTFLRHYIKHFCAFFYL